MLKLAQTDWKEDVKAVAKIMHKEDAAKKWLDQYEKKAAEKGREN